MTELERLLAQRVILDNAINELRQERLGMEVTSTCRDATERKLMRRIGVTGGRDFNDGELLDAMLSRYCTKGDLLIHGNALGADRDAALWFFDKGWPIEPHNADWGKYGKGAGPRRNQEMVDSGLDLLIAFPGGKGTADMVRRAEKAGVNIAKLILAPPASRRTRSTR